MATYFRGSFKDIKQNTISIEIISPNGQAEYDLDDKDSPVKIAYDSIEISYDIDDMFSAILKKRMSINLTSRIYLGDIIFSDKIREVSVEVKKNNVCIFKGYVEPYTYSQPFAAVWEEFTVNCIDSLGILEYDYLVKHTHWADFIAREDTPSFKDYFEIIFPNLKVYYDGSKTISNNTSVFDGIGITYTPFLGDDPDDMMTNEEVTEEILKYLNLHIIQEGEDLYVFDWNTIKNAGQNVVFTNIFDSEDTVTKDLSKKTITKDSYNSDDTNVSMSETYNQISLKADLDFIDTVLDNPVGNDSTKFYSNYKQLWLSEYISSSNSIFGDIINQGYNHYKYINNDNGDWSRRDWFFKLAYNPKWKLKWGGTDINEWIERDENNKVINQHRLLECMRGYKYFPILISYGLNEEFLNKNNQSMVSVTGDVKGKITLNDYIAISVNGYWGLDKNADLEEIQESINQACGYDPVNNTWQGILEYVGNSSFALTPGDEETTNYLILKAKITLNPIKKKSSTSSMHWVNYLNKYILTGKPGSDIILFKTQVDSAFFADGTPNSFTKENIYKTDGYYAQQFYTALNAGDEEVSAPETLMFYPYYSGDEACRYLAYNYSAHWDDTDRIDKLPILECELKIGDKYLVETYLDEDKQKPLYGWYTEDNLPYVKIDAEHTVQKRTFSIGFDPSIGDFIIGKEYDISNNVNAKISDEKGLAIPINYDDKVNGKLSFKILCPINQQWNEITRRHPTLFRSTKYSDNYYNLWNYVSSIIIKDFEINVISDNKGSDVAGSKQDVVYISNETTNVIEKKDDIEFKVCTKPTTQELIDRGIDTNVANNTTVNLSTNESIESITDNTQNVTNRPERLYVDQYWNIYSSPKTIVETTLTDNYNTLNVLTFNDFGDTIPISIRQNLQFCQATVKTMQI